MLFEHELINQFVLCQILLSEICIQFFFAIFFIKKVKDMRHTRTSHFRGTLRRLFWPWIILALYAEKPFWKNMNYKLRFKFTIDFVPLYC